MKIAIINQPTNNRGDEAAHRSLIRTLLKSTSESKFYILFFGSDINSIKDMQVEDPRVQYIAIKEDKGTLRVLKLALYLHMEKFISKIFPCIKKYCSYIKECDIILCAPGGICMGGFQNWHHLAWLKFSKALNKKIIYYSRSIGPFPLKSHSNRKFANISIELLKYFSFLSLRDKRSMNLADQLGVKYIPSIDTAFLDRPQVKLPQDLIFKKYIVFVPNSLTWHPAYKNIDQQKINNLYIRIANFILTSDLQAQIIMLPQLFNDKRKPDVSYFESLKSQINNNRVIVLPETISSDLQQMIISNSQFVIGARYHSIVFAINNLKPFISLSYEHKMTGLLSLLQLNSRELNISNIGENNFNENEFLNKFKELYTSPLNYDMIKVCNKAHQIAQNCFDIMKNEFLQ